MKSEPFFFIFLVILPALCPAIGAENVLSKEKCVLGISFGMVLIYPPDVNEYLTKVEQGLNLPAFPRRLVLAHGLEMNLELRPSPFLDISPWISVLYSARRFRSVSWDFFVPTIDDPMMVRLVDVAGGFRFRFGRYLPGEWCRLRGGFSLSNHFTQLYVIENTDHVFTAWAMQFSLAGGVQVHLFDRVFFDLDAEIPVNSLPLRVTAGSDFSHEKFSIAATPPKNAYLCNLTLRPEVRVNLKKKRLPDVL